MAVKPSDPAKQKEAKFRELESQFAGNSEMLAMSKATWLSSRGNSSGESGKLDADIADFEEAIQIKPDHLPSYFSLAIAYQKKGFTDKAEQILNAAPEQMKLNGKVVGTKKEILDSM